jgi:hypothetical protein
LGEPGEPCAHCGAPLLADQRYCLNCGTRRGEPRVAFADYVRNGSAEGVAVRQVTVEPRASDVSPLAAVLGIALLGGMLLIGVLLGRGEDEQAASSTPVAEQTSDPSTAGTTPPPVGGEVSSEWPAATDGFTVELGTLAKEGTTAEDVEATRADLELKGATDVGVLDSDLYPSLAADSYVFYSGVYTSRADAEDALDALDPELSDAVVAQVSAGTDSAGSGGASTPDLPGLEGLE